jgi:hypothetical protein
MTTFTSEVIPAPVALIGAGLSWCLAGIFLAIGDLHKNDHGTISPAVWLGSLGLVCASLSLAALAVWLLIIYFYKCKLYWHLLSEDAVCMNNYGGGNKL